MMINSLLTLAFGITLTCFGLFHLVLVLKGATTIEFGSYGYLPYDLGWKRNFYSIFGENWLLWFIPVPTMNGDGYEYVAHDENAHGLLTDNHHVYHLDSEDDQLVTPHQRSLDSMTNEDDDNEISDFSSDDLTS